MGDYVEKPVVSVIMPVYNGAKYIAQAIDSVLCQRVPVEILVIDDCSTDDTRKIVESYSSLLSLL